MNALTVPTQRAVRLMTTTYNWDAPLLGSMTPLERAAVAQYAVEKLQALGPLSPLEALVGARSLNKTKRTKMLRTVRAEYPQLTASYLEEMSSLDKHYRHTHFSQYDARTQLLIAQCEAVHLRLESIADPPRSPATMAPLRLGLLAPNAGPARTCRRRAFARHPHQQESPDVLAFHRKSPRPQY